MAWRGMLKKLPIDTFMLLLVATVLLATLLPVSGGAAKFVSQLSYAAVALLFFLYGAKLEGRAIIAGMANWKLQVLIFATTFVLFPSLAYGLWFVVEPWLPQELAVGLIFLCILPSTVQSSIALTAMARGNVSAAICATSLSNMLGVVLTPAFAALLLSTHGPKLDARSVVWICVQLLLPFVVGHLLRPLIGKWIERHKLLTAAVDRGSILLIVYSAFSAGVVAGIWGRLDASTLALLLAIDLGLLLLVMIIVRQLGKAVGLSRADEVSLLFCGSQKSLASGVPIANILFAGHATGLIILPLMLYHQIQLFVCTAIAQRYAAKAKLGAEAIAGAYSLQKS